MQYDVLGAKVAERLACAPPTKAIRVQSPAGSLRILARGNHAGRCRRSAALSFRCCSILTSITLIGSQDLAVKSRPNHSTLHSTTTRKESKRGEDERDGERERERERERDGWEQGAALQWSNFNGRIPEIWEKPAKREREREGEKERRRAGESKEVRLEGRPRLITATNKTHDNVWSVQRVVQPSLFANSIREILVALRTAHLGNNGTRRTWEDFSKRFYSKRVMRPRTNKLQVICDGIANLIMQRFPIITYFEAPSRLDGSVIPDVDEEEVFLRRRLVGGPSRTGHFELIPRCSDPVHQFFVIRGGPLIGAADETRSLMIENSRHTNFTANFPARYDFCLFELSKQLNQQQPTNLKLLSGLRSERVKPRPVNISILRRAARWKKHHGVRSCPANQRAGRRGASHGIGPLPGGLGLSSAPVREAAIDTHTPPFSRPVMNTISLAGGALGEGVTRACGSYEATGLLRFINHAYNVHGAFPAARSLNSLPASMSLVSLQSPQSPGGAEKITRVYTSSGKISQINYRTSRARKRAPAYLGFPPPSLFETEKRWSDRVDTASSIKCPIAAKRHDSEPAGSVLIAVRTPEETRRPAASSSGTINTCDNPGVARPGIEPGSSYREASRLTAQPPRPLQGTGQLSFKLGGGGGSNYSRATSLTAM
ncbi:hypothetical protein PR048_031540 [Dryococelus australis]|uniref:Uncharacterized protein n=1 Tax=Dryococelus australis TaxID=614101 RepID=A0ABQ9G6N1_9NEOP|nr:hypothetical protein PR048_031540 [Dryococelus australis]